MENVLLFFTKNINFQLLIMILLGGIFIKKYTVGLRMANKYKVFIASIIFSTIFYFIDGCGVNCLMSYSITYLLTTTFYELFVKEFIEIINSLISKIKNK